MDLNAIKKAITATVSGGQYLPSDKIGFAGLPQPSSNFDAHFGAGSCMQIPQSCNFIIC